MIGINNKVTVFLILILEVILMVSGSEYGTETNDHQHKPSSIRKWSPTWSPNRFSKWAHRRRQLSAVLSANTTSSVGKETSNRQALPMSQVPMMEPFLRGRSEIQCQSCNPYCYVMADGYYHRLFYYAVFPGALYYISETQPELNWEEAYNYCADQFNGFLPSVHSDQELSFMQEELKKRSKIGQTFLGGMKIAGKWRWIDGTPTDWKVKWASGQPDNHGGSETVMQWYTDGGINDINSKTKQNTFVTCKKPCILPTIIDPRAGVTDLRQPSNRAAAIANHHDASKDSSMEYENNDYIQY